MSPVLLGTCKCAQLPLSCRQTQLLPVCAGQSAVQGPNGCDEAGDEIRGGCGRAVQGPGAHPTQGGTRLWRHVRCL